MKAKAIRTAVGTGTDGRQVEIEVELIWHSSNLNSWWLKITKGGVTGYESREYKDLEKLCSNRWVACMGTLSSWDRMVIEEVEMRRIVAELGPCPPAPIPNPITDTKMLVGGVGVKKGDVVKVHGTTDNDGVYSANPDCCKDCGGSMIGDGYTSVHHCENTPDKVFDVTVEPDAGPIYCGDTLPKWWDVDKKKAKDRSALEQFIHDEEPRVEEESLWRAGLQSVIKEVLHIDKITMLSAGYGAGKMNQMIEEILRRSPTEIEVVDTEEVKELKDGIKGIIEDMIRDVTTGPDINDGDLYSYIANLKGLLS